MGAATGPSGPHSDPAAPLDLCIVRPTLGQGGADRVTLTLLAHLDRGRFRPRLVLMRAEGAMLDRVPADVPVSSLGSRSLWTAWWPLSRRLRREPPAVLLSTSGGANLIAVLARLLSRRRMRLVLSERNVLYRDQGSGKRWLQARLKRWLYPHADCVTAVSQGVASDLTARLGLPAERIRVVYNPVVTPDIADLAAAEIDHPWYAERRPIVLAAGRLVPAKGFDLLIEAFAELDPAARLVVLGDGPLRRSLRRQADEAGIADRVWFAGFDPNPFRHMARCSVFALSSRYEGLPGALIQAMACGAAVVATDCAAGPAEIISDGADGLLVPVEDRRALTAGLGRLLEDEALRRRLGRAARRAVGRFSLAATLAGYAEALSDGPARQPEGFEYDRAP